jgi:hypothetical protein
VRPAIREDRIDRILFVAAGLGGLLHHVLLLARFGGLGWDEMWQLTAARSFVAGHGLTIPDAYFPEVDEVSYRQVVGWPPGYSLLAAGLLHFTVDLWEVARNIDIAATILFFVSLLTILQALAQRISSAVRIGLVLWVGFAASPLKDCLGTNLLALALYLGAIALGMPLLDDRRQHRTWLAACSGVLGGLSGWVRFAYWPLAPVIGLSLGLAGYLENKGRAALRYAAIQAGVTALVLGGAAAYQRQLTGGHPTYLSIYYGADSAKLHWKNLGAFHPFAADLTGASAVLSALGRIGNPGAGDSWAETTTLRWAASLVILTAAAFGLVRTARNRRAPDRACYVAVVSLLSLITCVGMLTYLSLRYPRFATGWTYVQEPRYYAPTALAIYVGLALLAMELPPRALNLVAAGRGLGFWAVVGALAVVVAVQRPVANAFLSRNQFAEHLRYTYAILAGSVQYFAARGSSIVFVGRDLNHLGAASMAGAPIVTAGDSTAAWLGRMRLLTSRMPADLSLLVALPPANGSESESGDGTQATDCPLVGKLPDGTPLAECRGRAERAPATPRVAAVGDFNGDGKLDLLWRALSGEIVAWYLDGLKQLGKSVIPQTAAPGQEWQIIGAADTDADGRSELFCRSRAGLVCVWYVDTAQRGRKAWVQVQPSIDTQWYAVTVGDFTGDGSAEVVWQDRVTGNVAVHLARGLRSTKTVVTTPPGPPDPLWQLVGADDIDGDRNPDLLWQKWSSGTVLIWFMSGFQRHTETRLDPPGVPGRWRVAGSGDFDGDGRAEIVWSNVGTGTVRIVPSGGSSAVEWRFSGSSSQQAVARSRSG